MFSVQKLNNPQPDKEVVIISTFTQSGKSLQELLEEILKQKMAK